MPSDQRSKSLSRAVAVVGVGETDYIDDYRRARAGERYNDNYGYGALAFRAALADAGLTRADIDGLVVGPTTAYERMAEVIGLDVRWAAQGDAVNAVMQGVIAVASGMAETVALVYGNAQRTAGVAYGGPKSQGDKFLSYVYYAPWGMTSQGALYAMMTQRYKELHGLDPKDLGRIAVGQRRHANMNPRAVMHKKELTMDAYLASEYITEPLRLYDYCLINDGGVALILTTPERAAKMDKPVVTISGLGRSELNVDATQLRPRLLDFYHSGHAETAEQVYNMADIGPQDVDSLQIYDSFSCHILYALEGFGFAKEGEAGKFLAETGVGPGEGLPINTSGGMLSESYMQGWNHQVEAVRQLRGECGERQIPNCRHVQYTSDVAGKVASIMYEGGR